MARLPKLRVRDWFLGYPREDIREFEQAREFLNFDSNTLVTVEGRVLICYDELVRLLSEPQYQDRDYLDVDLEPLLGGG